MLLYRWSGTEFVQFQRIQLSTSGGSKLSFDAFTLTEGVADGKSYIVLPLGFADRSGVYVYHDGKFELAQYISNTNL